MNDNEERTENEMLKQKEDFESKLNEYENILSKKTLEN